MAISICFVRPETSATVQCECTGVTTAFIGYGDDLGGRGHHEPFGFKASKLIYYAPNFCGSSYATVIASNPVSYLGTLVSGW